jgi:hypothetical protein
MEGFDEIVHYLMNLGDKRADAFVLQFDAFTHRLWNKCLGRLMNKNTMLFVEGEIDQFLKHVDSLGLPKPLITVEWVPMRSMFKLNVKPDKHHWSRWMFDPEYESDRYKCD